MKKAGIALAILLLLLALMAGASAVELKTGTVRAFGQNILTVTCEEGGLLTIEAWSGTLQLKNPATDLRIEAGETEIPWDGLSWGGEPMPAGKVKDSSISQYSKARPVTLIPSGMVRLSIS